MKKGLIGFIGLFIISMYFSGIANATYHLNSFSIQNRVKDKGVQFIRLVFECVDSSNNYPTQDVLGSVVLTDPNGSNVAITVQYTSDWEANGSYNPGNGQWTYNSPYFYSYYYQNNFSSQLITGTYHLKFTDKNGETSEKDFVMNQAVSLPIIPSSSCRYHRDQNGNFICYWQVPDTIDSSLQTKAAAWISMYDEKNNYLGELFVGNIPTQMGFLFVPKSVMDQGLAMGKKFALGIRIATTDNCNRSYSTEVPISFNQGQTSVFASFTGLGLWSYGPYTGAWTNISSTSPGNMVYSGLTLYASFGTTDGLWKWDGFSWSQLTTIKPENMTTSTTALYADFGTTYGLWKWDGFSWVQLTSAKPDSMVAAGSGIYVSFAGYGLYRYDGSSWSKLSGSNPEKMVGSN